MTVPLWSGAPMRCLRDSLELEWLSTDIGILRKSGVEMRSAIEFSVLVIN